MPEKNKEEIKMTGCDNKKLCTAHRDNNEYVRGGVLFPGELSKKQKGEFNATKKLTKRIISFMVALAMTAALMPNIAFASASGVTDTFGGRKHLGRFALFR